MRTFFVITLIILAGIFSAIFIGFDVSDSTGNHTYDDEQEMLDEQIVIRFSHVVAETSPKGATVRKFAELVYEKTEGKVKVDVFPNGVLYNDNNEWEAIQSGSVEMIAPASSKLAPYYPRFQVLDLPFIFPNDQAVREAYEGKIGQQLMGDMKHDNAKPLTFWYNGFKQITYRKHPILNPEDFERTHFRTMPSEVIKEQFQMMGASTSVIPFNKIYRNLEVQFVDGQENTISNIYTKKFYKHQPYVTFSQHGYLGYVVLINRDFWEALPEDLQMKIREALAEATDWNRRHAIEINDRHTRALKRTGQTEVHFLTPEQREEWEKQLEPIYAKFKPIIGEGLMEEALNIRETYSR
ncbi:C4-dicarboxylate-binding protein DctP [Melghiribacillus thermohalophilus]|uniref:C4-dicarboxylate-binding protein DctP n=1 Tax=Melghiribacillus thermohalophilus TaxID=1324956 RepID=A0A4R3MSG3_9BACI|nr:DctP family TRAP transporter solute-binding subunit [Melghiribacillus thermohalophilus]TCT18272.1 C4-dicarboxylate-binding protein DctP [Melghiribacillus thermohalophilus]